MIKRVFSAYAIATALSVLPGLLFAELVNTLGFVVQLWQPVAALWLLVVGLPSMLWSSQNLSRALGVKPPVIVRRANRGVVAGGALASAARSIFNPAAPDPTTVIVPDECEIVIDGEAVPDQEIHGFLRRAWQRQQQGQAPFSRQYWRRYGWERARYDGLIEALTACGVCTGRRPGKSGKMRMTPLSAMHRIRGG